MGAADALVQVLQRDLEPFPQAGYLSLPYAKEPADPYGTATFAIGVPRHNIH
jgi:hypothetical protein